MARMANRTSAISRLRRISQIAFLLLFISTWLLVANPNISPIPAQLVFWLNPYTSSLRWLTDRSWTVPLLALLFSPLLTILLGRVWCGWICPTGTLIDYLKIPQLTHHEPPKWFTKIKYLLLISGVVFAIFGLLPLAGLDPITLLQRGFSFYIFPILSNLVLYLERLLLQFSGMDGLLAWMDTALRIPLLREPHFYYTNSAWVGVILVVIFLLNALGERFWCRYLCPLGGILAVISRFSFLQRTVADDCSSCHQCIRKCPMGTIDSHRNYQSDPAECIVCTDCIAPCNQQAVKFTWVNPFKPAHYPYDVKRREMVGTLIATAALAIGAQPSSKNRRRNSRHLLPPGSIHSNMTSRCIRCGLCVRGCPTNALHPSNLENGIEAFWTPGFIPRLGYCDYSCTRCGEVCPVEVIPHLPLPDKRKEIIGTAVIIRDRCIAWAEERECIVCEEMCPLPEKAIRLETTNNIINPEVGKPIVVKDLCIGCGICEYKCPIPGDSAIQIHQSTNQV